MKNKKAIELLTSAMGNEGDMVYCFEVNGYSGEIPQGNEAKRIELIRLALLCQQPKCKTCGGNRKCPLCKGGGVTSHEGYGNDVEYDCSKCNGSGKCLSCQQPEAGEFTKRFRGLIEIYKEYSDYTRLSKSKVGCLRTYGKEACARLDAAEQEKEDLISGHFCPSPQLSKLAESCNCAHSDEHRAVDWATIERLEAELASAREDNKRLKEKARSWRSVAERLEREKQA